MEHELTSLDHPLRKVQLRQVAVQYTTRTGDSTYHGRLFSEASSAAMWNPETIEPINPVPPGFEATKPMFRAYALGWEVSEYGGAKIISHSGGVFGP